MDWQSLAKELSQEGFFELCGANPQNITDDEIAQYAKSAGLKTLAEIQSELEAQRFENDLDKIWSFFGGFEKFLENPKNLSKSFLNHLKSVHTPDPNERFYGGKQAKQKRYQVGNYFEDMLEGNDTISKYNLLTEKEIGMVKRMVATAQADEHFSPILNSPFCERQRKETVVIFGYKFTVVLDFYSEFGTEEEKLRFGYELKTTTETTDNGFLKACEKFDYWLQYRLYSEVCPNGYEMFGVSKKKDVVLHLVPTKEHFEAGEKLLLEAIELLKYYGIDQYFKA